MLIVVVLAIVAEVGLGVALGHVLHRAHRHYQPFVARAR